MATDAEILVTRAELKATTPTYVGTPATGRIRLTASGITTEVGDTKWRDVTSLLANGWTATKVLLRRSGQHSAIRFTNLSGANATSSYFLSIPAGFFVGGMAIPVRIGANWQTIGYNGAALSLLQSAEATTSPVQGAQFVGNMAWPSTVPGTEAAE